MGSINHQFGFKEETTYGTAVTVDRFLEFTSENLLRQQNIGGSEGIRPGTRLGRGSTRRITRNWAEGTVNFEVAQAGFGKFFEHLLGTVSTTQPDVTNSSTVYLHTFTPATLTGKGLTIQKGVEKNDGTVQAFTYPGSKIRSVDLSNDQDGVLQMAVDFLSKQEVTSTALASSSYTAPTVFHYGQGTIKKDGTALANVRSLNSLNIVNNLIPRFNMGNDGLMSEPLNRPRDTAGGNLAIEFANLTDFHTAFAEDTSLQLVTEWIGDTISDDETYIFRVTLEDVRFVGETPTVSDESIVVTTVPFEAYDSGDSIKIEYQTTDATP